MDQYSTQYDASIGGHVVVPDGENTFQYAEKRLPELASLISTIKNPTKSKLIFQTIPNHMRRRTAAQNPKRLPVRFRQGHISQMKKSGMPTKKKRPSRKYRRRPSNLRKEYARRQMKVSWMETHIWHAKRFHMTKKWGYKIPWAPCDKSYRACYRAAAKHCLIQDISFMNCVEIRGKLEELSPQLRRLCNPSELSFTAKCYTSGQREGTLDVFKHDKYPLGAIGKVSFFWKPPGQEELSRLWIFIHPSFHNIFISELEDLFHLKRISEMDVDEEKTVDEQSLTVYRCPGSSVEVQELRPKLNRFRLTGPLSNAVLSRALKCKQNPEIDSHDFSPEAHEIQMKYWNEISEICSPAELPSNIILSLTVEDPRINRPQKRTKALPEALPLKSAALKIPPQINISAIWDQELRKNLPEGMMNTGKYYERRKKEALAPGERCSFEEKLQALPLLLIQRPGLRESSKPLGFCSGWDVIVPAGYGIITWVSLIMWGARAGGWRETISTHREMGRDVFAPDTIVSQKEDVTEAEELRAKYFRRPSKKRPNYTKLSITSPFLCPWKQLVKEWSEDSSESFYVLRDRKILDQCEKALKYQQSVETIALTNAALIPVYIHLISRGNPGNFSIVSLPQPEDLKKKHSSGNGILHFEPVAKDSNSRIRKTLRQKHTHFLKKQRRMRIRLKKKLQEKSTERVKLPRKKSPLVLQECCNFKEKMEELWVPKTPSKIKDQCSRTVIGYVTQSDFIFTDSTVSAIGYVTWNGFRELVERCKKFKQVIVLVRGTRTRNYRGGSISIRRQ